MDGSIATIASTVEWLLTYMQDPANLLSLLAMSGSAGFAIVSYLSQRRASEQAQETKRRLALVQQEGLRASLDAQVIRWGTQVIEAIAEAEQIAASRQRFPTAADLELARDRLVSRLSAQVDQGRLFFPNVSHDLVGLDRPFANRGFRPPILDALLLVHGQLRLVAFDAPDDTVERDRSALFRARRAFVSELQRALDPRRRQLIFDNFADNRELEHRGDDVVWDSVIDLVDEFERTQGEGTFWGQRPQPRRELLADRPDAP